MENVLQAFRELFPDATVQNGFEDLTFLKIAKKDAREQGEKWLLAHGFEKIAERMEEGNLFSDYRKGEIFCHFSFFPEQDAPLRISLHFQKEEGKSEIDRSGVCDTLVTQVRLTYCAADCGMSYAVRTDRGRFLVIDGGYNEYEEADRLFEVLQSQNVSGGRIRISAWIITHPHGDHFEVFCAFMKKYADRVILERILYQWPADEMCKYPCDHRKFDETVAECEKNGTLRITPHTGQRYRFDNVILDCLFTAEDLYPEIIRNTNDTSLVFRMEAEGKRFLWLGDAQKAASDCICRHFPEESLRCDVLQVGHHGYDGGSPELYQKSDPTDLFWPCPDFWYHPVRKWKSNEFLRESKKIREVWISGRETTVLNLKKAFPTAVCPENRLPYEPDLARIRRVIDLHWSCITGGETGYGSVWLTLTGEGCRMQRAEVGGICQFLRPDETELTPSYTLHIQGHGTADELAIVCNCEEPTLPLESGIFRFTLDEKGNADVTLTADAGCKTITVCGSGGFDGVYPYQPAQRRSLGLYLKNADFTLTKLSVKSSG